MSEKATANFLTTKHAFKLTTKQDARYVPVHKKKKQNITKQVKGYGSGI